MDLCRHASTQCPISGSACPGICIYAEILRNINMAIIVFDVVNAQVIFRNRLFDEIFPPADGDFSALYGMFITAEYETCGLSEPYSGKPLQYDGKVLGYTIYRVAEKFIWIFLRDITEKLRLESIAEAVNISSNIGYVFSGVRHEIGNPINSIKVALSVLRDNIDHYPRETVLKYIDRTLDDIGRVEYLLRSLKNFNLYESPVIEDIELSLFMKRFVSLIGRDFEDNQIDVDYVLYPGAEWVRADPRALQQVLLNIVTNSMDAVAERENPYILMTIFKSGRHIQIAVEDNGCGLPEERQQDLFKPFFTSKAKGTGLGLIITRKMLAHMAGTIAVESYQGLGTIVHITLPEGAGDG